MKPILRRAPYLWSALVLYSLLGASCGSRLPQSLSMDTNPMFTGGTGWIVVSEAYVRVKAEPSPESKDSGHLRGGDMLPVLGREKLPGQGALWYRVKTESGDGWLLGAQALFFDSRDAAERASSQFK